MILTLAALCCPPPHPPRAKRLRRIAIVVPAHDEAGCIASTVTNLLGQRYPSSAFGVWVVADNCTDATAALARKAGARVIERRGDPGKGQALHTAFQHLLQEGWEAFLVVDADSHLHPETLQVCNDHLEGGSQVLQVRGGVLNPAVNWRTRALELSLASLNALRPLGKAALGLSAGLFNGFCLSRETLEQVPYLARSIVEDTEYHMLLLRAGLKVNFRDDVWAKSLMPENRRAAKIQRVRWERGRWLLLRCYFRPFLIDLLKGQPRALDGLLELLMPPMSVIVLLWGAAACLGQGTAALAGLAFIALHYLIAAWRYAYPPALLGLALVLPYYVVEKTLVVLYSFIKERHLPWMRTERPNPPAGGDT